MTKQGLIDFQEKYMSEPYSEAPDSEAARRLLEFGDDYRNFLDSQSDCASSLSARRDVSPPLPRKRKQHVRLFLLIVLDQISIFFLW